MGLINETARADASAAASKGGRTALLTGRVMSGLAILFLAVDSLGKLLEVPQVVEGSVALGYPANLVFGLGVVLLASLAAHLVPRLSVLGAILLTGYLGGAVATHVRVGNPLFTHTLFPVYVAFLIWGGLALRDVRVRTALLRTGA
jgi:hypothetical protein